MDKSTVERSEPHCSVVSHKAADHYVRGQPRLLSAIFVRLSGDGIITEQTTVIRATPVIAFTVCYYGADVTKSHSRIMRERRRVVSYTILIGSYPYCVAFVDVYALKSVIRQSVGVLCFIDNIL